MEMRKVFIILLVFAITWTNVDGRKILISGNAGLLKMSSIALALPEFPRKGDVPQDSIPFSFGASLDFICNTCAEVSKQAEQFLADSYSLEHIQKIAKDICKSLPSDSSEKCKEMLEIYTQDALIMLQDYFSEEKFCIGTGLCLANYTGDFYLKMRKGSQISLVDAINDKTCEICEQFTEEAIYYLSQKNTQTEILSAFYHACSKLQVFSDECKSLVDYYAPLIFIEVAMLSPEEFCEKINLCSSSVNPSGSRQQNNCDLCEQALLELKTKLKDPETEIKLIEALLNACEYMPNHVKECKRLVFEYGPLILTNVEKYLDANDLCSKIHVCEPIALYIEWKKSESKPLIKLPLEEFQAHPSTK